uniref:Uncharacterized protein n=1 Tax=Solanum tuberosum TaxID=4113 RepID=M1DZX7_SOLTU
MPAQVAKQAEQPVQVPTPIMPESLMKIFDEQPTTQSLDDIWGKLPKNKYGKRKKKVGESDDELPVDLSREVRRQEMKARKASRKDAREKEALEKQQRDAVLAGASGSGAPVP